MTEEKFDDLVAELMQNPKFREEYDALEPEFNAVRAEMSAHESPDRRNPIAPRNPVRPAVGGVCL